MKVILFLSFLINLLFASEKLDAISLQLVWLHQFQSAGFYVAQEKGFYKEVGLHVNIKEHTNGIDVVEDVLSQKSTYGISRPTLIIDKNHHKDVVALLALFQSSPSVLITTNPNIKQLKDLKNKKVMMTPDEASSVAIMAMLFSNGLKPTDLILQQHSYKVEDLIKNNTDAMASYISNEPFALNQNHVPYTIFNPKDYGFDFYEDILFTSGDEITYHEQRVRNFYAASKKGWEWAFNNIEESAKIIQEKYNSQNKSLEALIYEGNELKKLAFTHNKEFGIIEQKKFEDIANIYKLSGFIKSNYTLEGFIDPLHLSKKIIKIGVLANRGNKFESKIWDETAHFLSQMIPSYHFVILPLSFQKLEESLKKQEIDFISTNPLHYVQLEHTYSISRIATLSVRDQNKFYTKYGSVLFTRADNPLIEQIEDIKHKVVGAVDAHSFGGFILALKELKNHNIEQNDLKKITFLQTHDRVVQAVLDKKIDVGIVRTTILEKMQEEGALQLSDIKVLGQKHFNDFPLLTSTELYPEWAFAKLPHTSESLANDVLSVLLKTSAGTSQIRELSWKAPQDYSKVHSVLKDLKLYPYDSDEFTFEDVFHKYKYWFLVIFVFFFLIILAMAHIKKLNLKLSQRSEKAEESNETLEREVEDQIRELKLLNAKLKALANTDELTKIDNRRHFMELSTAYFYTSLRNHTDLHILSLDIDYFKKINDTHGHAIGDEVLKLFCRTIQKCLRQSDIFGRIGGEEFCICVQNTNLEGTITLANKIRLAVEATPYKKNMQEHLHITVSIGIASLQKGDIEIFDVMKRADLALYKAKQKGRNQVQVLPEHVNSFN